MNHNEVLAAFVQLYKSGAQGCEMDCDSAQDMAECISRLTAENEAAWGFLTRINTILDFGTAWENPAIIEGGTDDINALFDEIDAALSARRAAASEPATEALPDADAGGAR